MDLCDTAYITKIDRTYEADAYFPNLDEKDDWEITHETVDAEEQTYFDLIFFFYTYRKKK